MELSKLFESIYQLNRLQEENSTDCFIDLLRKFLNYIKERRGKPDIADMTNCWTNYDMDSRVKDILIDRFNDELEKINRGILNKNDFLEGETFQEFKNNVNENLNQLKQGTNKELLIQTFGPNYKQGLESLHKLFSHYTHFIEIALNETKNGKNIISTN